MDAPTDEEVAVRLKREEDRKEKAVFIDQMIVHYENVLRNVWMNIRMAGMGTKTLPRVNLLTQDFLFPTSLLEQFVLGVDENGKVGGIIEAPKMILLMMKVHDVITILAGFVETMKDWHCAEDVRQFVLYCHSRGLFH